MKLFLSRRQAAQSLGISVRTLDKLIHQGRIATRHIGRRVLISSQQIRDYARPASGNDRLPAVLRKAPPLGRRGAAVRNFDRIQ
jgi:excisionase family DNA binding protein